MPSPSPCFLVENPLLCFIQNYRHLADLHKTIYDFYSPNAIQKAKELLIQYTTSLSRQPLNWPDSVLECYDLAINNRCRTRFACANLAQLPVVMKVSNDEDISTTFLLRELREMRSLLMNTIACHKEAPNYSQQVIPSEESMVIINNGHTFSKQQAIHMPTTQQIPQSQFVTNTDNQALNISVNENSFTSSDCSTSTDSKNSTPESPVDSRTPIRRKRHRTLDETLEKLSEKKQHMSSAGKSEHFRQSQEPSITNEQSPADAPNQTVPAFQQPAQQAPSTQQKSAPPLLNVPVLPPMSGNTSTRDYLNALNSVRPDLAHFCTNLFNQMTVTPPFKPLMKPLDIEEEMKDIEIARGESNDSEEDEGIMDELGLDEEELEDEEDNRDSESPEKQENADGEKNEKCAVFHNDNDGDDCEAPKRKRGRRRKDELGESDADRIYVCSRPECQKRFANKFLLKKHEFIHTGMKPHICHYCGKGFNRKDNLIRHVRTHEQNPRFCENLMRQNRSLVETINGLFPSLANQNMSMLNREKEEDD